MTDRAATLTHRVRQGFGEASGFKLASLLLSLLVVALIVAAFGRLSATTWHTYGTGFWSFYRHDVFGDRQTRKALLNTVIIATSAGAIGVFLGVIFAWLNERTDASIGAVGRVLPLVPFLMPAIALPLGWVLLASPTAGILNVLLRSSLSWAGIHRESGPLDIYGWWGLILLYSVVLTGFAYLMLVAPVRDLDGRLEDAARLSGASAPKILFRIVLPILRPAMVNAFFLCMMIALSMVSVPLIIGQSAEISVISIVVLNLMTGQFLPLYADAFLVGLTLLIPVSILWLLQRKTTRSGRSSMVGAKAPLVVRARLGRWRHVGRGVFLGYIAIAVVLPLLALLYLAGLGLWSKNYPNYWNPLPHLSAILTDPTVKPAILSSVKLGLLTGAALIAIAYIVSYGQRFLPRLGSAIDVIVKVPAVITPILMAVALILLLGGAPFHLIATPWILVIGYFVVFLPFASVVTIGALHEIGSDVIEAAQLSGSSELRTFTRIATPLAWPTLVAGFLLMFVFISGDVNISLMLANSRQPVVGLVMVDLFSFGSMPQVASFALIMTLLNLVLITVFMGLLTARRSRPPLLSSLRRRHRIETAGMAPQTGPQSAG